MHSTMSLVLQIILYGAALGLTGLGALLIGFGVYIARYLDVSPFASMVLYTPATFYVTLGATAWIGALLSGAVGLILQSKQ